MRIEVLLVLELPVNGWEVRIVIVILDEGRCGEGIVN